MQSVFLKVPHSVGELSEARSTGVKDVREEILTVNSFTLAPARSCSS